MYRIDSGLGGVFHVKIVKDNNDGTTLVEVVNCGPDWNGYRFSTPTSNLTQNAPANA